MRVLMCQTDYFRIDIEINDWMDKNRQPDQDRARRQWQRIVSIYERLGVIYWFIEPEPECQDMCFAANAGWCRWGKVILSNFVAPKVAEVRQAEILYYENWFRKYRAKMLGIEIVPFPMPGKGFEGQGDVVTVGSGKNDSLILVGYGQGRTDYEAAQALAQVHRLSKDQVIPLRLVNGKFYHLDTACLFIPPKTLLYYPDAFDAAGKRILETLPVEPLPVDDEDAYRFVCNGVFVQGRTGTTVVINRPSKKLEDQLHNRGYRVCRINTSEFIKSGGSVRCLTFFLPEEKSIRGVSRRKLERR